MPPSSSGKTPSQPPNPETIGAKRSLVTRDFLLLDGDHETQANSNASSSVATAPPFAAPGMAALPLIRETTAGSAASQESQVTERSRQVSSDVAASLYSYASGSSARSGTIETLRTGSKDTLQSGNALIGARDREQARTSDTREDAAGSATTTTRKGHDGKSKKPIEVVDLAPSGPHLFFPPVQLLSGATEQDLRLVERILKHRKFVFTGNAEEEEEEQQGANQQRREQQERLLDPNSTARGRENDPNAGHLAAERTTVDQQEGPETSMQNVTAHHNDSVLENNEPEQWDDIDTRVHADGDLQTMLTGGINSPQHLQRATAERIIAIWRVSCTNSAKISSCLGTCPELVWPCCWPFGLCFSWCLLTAIYRNRQLCLRTVYVLTERHFYRIIIDDEDVWRYSKEGDEQVAETTGQEGSSSARPGGDAMNGAEDSDSRTREERESSPSGGNEESSGTKAKQNLGKKATTEEIIGKSDVKDPQHKSASIEAIKLQMKGNYEQNIKRGTSSKANQKDTSAASSGQMLNRPSKHAFFNQNTTSSNSATTSTQLQERGVKISTDDKSKKILRLGTTSGRVKLTELKPITIIENEETLPTIVKNNTKLIKEDNCVYEAMVQRLYLEGVILEIPRDSILSDEKNVLIGNFTMYVTDTEKTLELLKEHCARVTTEEQHSFLSSRAVAEEMFVGAAGTNSTNVSPTSASGQQLQLAPKQQVMSSSSSSGHVATFTEESRILAEQYAIGRMSYKQFQKKKRQLEKMFAPT
ncbi:unnamed protein product [Amoebophrya sp. A120]|nr:unnamed protein product [Amoebophrya sp. A120]|eukprot:GSA120T00010617001.1